MSILIGDGYEEYFIEKAEFHDVIEVRILFVQQ